MKRLLVAEVHARKVAELGLDATALDLTSLEALACMLRRSASHLCPCSAATLIRDVMRPLRGLVPDVTKVREPLEDTLEALVAHGDLLEYAGSGQDGARPSGPQLYAAPPSFLSRDTGAVILLGVGADRPSGLPDDLEARLENVSYIRRLTPNPGESLRSELLQLGLLEVPSTAWLKTPKLEKPADHVARLNVLLDAAPPSRDVSGLRVLDSALPVRYYPGRWVAPKAKTGRFVGRRSQAYGADLWSYVELQDGRPERLIDLPTPMSRWRGCDEAWRLQLAIDALRGEPQRFRSLVEGRMTCVLELFSPLPAWARRRWDAVGEPVPRSGCLFAYRFPINEVAEELRFARDVLWITEAGPAKEPA